MTPDEFARLSQLVWELWPNSRSRPADTGDAQRMLAARWPAFADVDAEAAAAAVYALYRTSKFEPSGSEILTVISRQGETDWARGWERLVAAVHEFQTTTAPRVDYVEHDDGSVSLIADEHTPTWKQTAGGKVTDWLERSGGVLTAAERLGDPTYRAQFRDWWNTVAARPDLDEGARAARRLAGFHPDDAPGLPRPNADRLAELASAAVGSLTAGADPTEPADTPTRSERP